MVTAIAVAVAVPQPKKISRNLLLFDRKKLVDDNFYSTFNIVDRISLACLTGFGKKRLSISLLFQFSKKTVWNIYVLGGSL